MELIELKYAIHSATITKPCKFVAADAVLCDKGSVCSRCGWNPEVAKARSKRIRAWMNRQPIQPPREKWYIGNGAYPNKTRWR